MHTVLSRKSQPFEFPSPSSSQWSEVPTPRHPPHSLPRGMLLNHLGLCSRAFRIPLPPPWSFHLPSSHLCGPSPSLPPTASTPPHLPGVLASPPHHCSLHPSPQNPQPQHALSDHSLLAWVLSLTPSLSRNTEHGGLFLGDPAPAPEASLFPFPVAGQTSAPHPSTSFLLAPA